MSAGKKGQIDSAKVIIREVFSRFWFRIPDYQRALYEIESEIRDLEPDLRHRIR